MHSTLKTVAAVTLTASITLLAVFAALAFQGGIIADSTGGVGHLHPVELATGWLGSGGAVAAVVMFVVDHGLRKRRR